MNSTSAPIRRREEISALRESGRIAGLVLRHLASVLKPGVSAASLDDLARKLIMKQGASPAFTGEGFPHAVSVSLNDEACHGIPSSSKILREGDIVKLDTGVCKNGWMSDAAWSFAVGSVDFKTRRLLTCAQSNFLAALRELRAGNPLARCGAAVEKEAARNGSKVIRRFAGHGIGREVHEAPKVPAFETGGESFILKNGMTLTAEPVTTLGNDQVKLAEDGVTWISCDGERSAVFEHTVLIGWGHAELLTAW